MYLIILENLHGLLIEKRRKERRKEGRKVFFFFLFLSSSHCVSVTVPPLRRIRSFSWRRFSISLTPTLFLNFLWPTKLTSSFSNSSTCTIKRTKRKKNKRTKEQTTERTAASGTKRRRGEGDSPGNQARSCGSFRPGPWP